MIDFRSGYYHICLTKEAAEKTAFVIDMGKWIFHSLPFGINIGPSAFSYVLGKVLTQCTEFALNYLDDIMIFSKTWQDHVNHLEEVFKHLQDVDLKIKCMPLKTKTADEVSVAYIKKILPKTSCSKFILQDNGT